MCRKAVLNLDSKQDVDQDEEGHGLVVASAFGFWWDGGDVTSRRRLWSQLEMAVHKRNILVPKMKESKNKYNRN